jgi:hypothetical protein
MELETAVLLLLGLKSVYNSNFRVFHHPAYLEFASNRSKSNYAVISIIPYWNFLKVFGRGYNNIIMLGKAGKWLTRIGT